MGIISLRHRAEGVSFKLLRAVPSQRVKSDIHGILWSGTDVVTVYSFC